MKLLIPFTLCLLASSCIREPKPKVMPLGQTARTKTTNSFAAIGTIPAPEGYWRSKATASSFTGWLRQLPLKKDKTVFLYNGQKKKNQQAQFAVLAISAGNSDLQQCADVVIRLRAEYLFAKDSSTPFAFTDFEGKEYRWNGGNNRKLF